MKRISSTIIIALLFVGFLTGCNTQNDDNAGMEKVNYNPADYQDANPDGYDNNRPFDGLNEERDSTQRTVPESNQNQYTIPDSPDRYTMPDTNQDQNTGNDQTPKDITGKFEQKVINLTNKKRKNNGLQPVKLDPELAKVAQKKSNDMMKNHYFSHTSPTYGSPFDMMHKFGIDFRSASENIAAGQQTPKQVVNAWMNSPGHRRNILDENVTHIGVGYSKGGSREAYWSQMFIQKQK